VRRYGLIALRARLESGIEKWRRVIERAGIPRQG
jgi:hypothetical protein